MRKGNEIAYVDCVKLERKSVRVEVRHEELVDELKDELCSMVRASQEEECLKAENTRKKIDDEYELGARGEHVEESDKYEESEKDVESHDDAKSEDVVESKEEKEHGDSEEKEENKNGDLLRRVLDGWCLIAAR